MKKNKFYFFILTFLLSSSVSILFSSVAMADDIEDRCAASSGYTPGMPDTPANHGIIVTYNTCVSEARRMAQEQQNAPPNPGNTPPTYNCTGRTGNALTQCQTLYNANLQSYNTALALYQQYLAQHPTMNIAQTASATQILEDVAAKQQKAAEAMRSKSNMLRTLGMILIAAGTAILFLQPVAGGAMIAAGAILVVYGMVTGGKANKLLADVVKTCEDYNKIATKPLVCPNAQEQVITDGVIPVPTTTSGTTPIPDFIDPTTGLCRPGAPVECSSIIKNLPAGCFKKGGACLAGGTTPNPVVTAKNGKVTLALNGKQKTFGLDDFASPASMVAAGFTPTQAKQFFSDLNNANGILAKNGLNAKGDLKDLSVPMASVNSSNSGTAQGSSGMKMDKDKYSDIASGDTSRVPASAEGLTKDYYGDTIGADGDNVFKMITRRYNIKRVQNIFMEEE